MADHKVNKPKTMSDHNKSLKELLAKQFPLNSGGRVVLGKATKTTKK